MSDPIAATGATPLTAGRSPATKATPIGDAQPGGQLGFDAFLKLLMAQLKAQSPLDPMDPTNFVSQLATLTQSQKTVQMQQSLDTLVATVQLQQAPALIGRDVSYLDVNTGAMHTSQVTKISLRDGKTALQLANGAAISPKEVLEVS